MSLPANAQRFYVSDSFTIRLANPPSVGQYEPDGHGGHIVYHQPGPANQDGVIGSNKTVRVYIKSCSIASLPIDGDMAVGINTDMFVGLYKVDSSPIVWQNRMPFASPYGTAGNGLICNQVSKLSNNTPRDDRDFGWEEPLTMGQQSGNGQFQVGGGFQFNFGSKPNGEVNILVSYSYHIKGYWTAE